MLLKLFWERQVFLLEKCFVPRVSHWIGDFFFFCAINEGKGRKFLPQVLFCWRSIPIDRKKTQSYYDNRAALTLF